MNTETVDHPAHYGGKDNPYEAIKVMRAWMTPQEYSGFLKGSAMKYMARHRSRGRLEDLRKCTWYQTALCDFVRDVGHHVVYPSRRYWVVGRDGIITTYDSLDDCCVALCQVAYITIVHSSEPFDNGEFVLYVVGSSASYDVFARREDAASFLSSLMESDWES